MVITGLYL
jgi:hypothetical protein